MLYVIYFTTGFSKKNKVRRNLAPTFRITSLFFLAPLRYNWTLALLACSVSEHFDIEAT